MGVPKFFRWMSERYPKINQRFGSPPNPETCQDYFDKPPPVPSEKVDPLSTCGLPPEIDRLYIDMNGVIHGCSHNNSSNVDDDGEGFDTVSRISNPEIFRNVCYYLDRVIGDMVQPKEVVYMAIDGVAPRAKLNQQRSRRYRSGTEGQIETNIYDAHVKSMEQQKEQVDQVEDDSAFDLENGYTFALDEDSLKTDQGDHLDVSEVSPGRFKGKFETQTQEIKGDTETFHSNVITPGTPFFTEFTEHLEHFVKYKMSTDPKWKDLTIIFSGPNVPGEGEHKIMQFIREEKQRPNYNPNLRHCIMGQDGDLIMLGLATHEPNLVLLRERVIFNMLKQKLRQAELGGLDAYIHNSHFEILHMEVLRNYLAFEFETSDVLQEAPWDLEHTIDDFVFMTFFVGNDFLPHMPALDIADNAFDLLFWTYKECRKKWLEEDPSMPYLTNRGSIVSGKRVEEFCSAIGSHEVAYYDKKKVTSVQENRRLRKEYKRFGMVSTVPHEDVVASKEAADRVAYRKMLQRIGEEETESDNDVFSPVVTGDALFRPSEEALEDGLISQMGNLLQNSISTETPGGGTGATVPMLDDQDLKGRYYHDKFQFSPFDQDKHLALRKAYLEGLVWNLKYYYEGCVSWEWFFPYHYGPMLSDLVDLENLLEQVNFEGRLGSPLRPFQQLMGCMPPSQARHIPESYRWLMTDPKSPIIDFYPKSFTIDMNGKRWPWEAVALLPFIDSTRLLAAYDKIDDISLTEHERLRNSVGNTVVMMFDPAHSEPIPAIGKTTGFGAIEESKVVSIPFGVSDWSYDSDETAVLEPVLHQDVQVPLPGFSSLRDAPVQSLWRRKNGLNVFGGKSRYKTSCLEVSTFMPPLPPVENLAPKLIGTSIFVNYPHFLEALVTSVSDEHTVVRGRNKPRRWTEKESEKWRVQRDGITRRFETGEGLTGTGGMIIPDGQSITLSVRPLEGLVKTDGITVKSYAKFEVEVPIISTFWNPSQPDPRLIGVPSRLEKNAFEVATPLHSAEKRPRKENPGWKRKKLFPPKPKSTVPNIKPDAKAMKVGDVGKAYYSSAARPPLDDQQFTTIPSFIDGRERLICGLRPPLPRKDEHGKRLLSSFASEFQPLLRKPSSNSLSVGLCGATTVPRRKDEHLKHLQAHKTISPAKSRLVSPIVAGYRGRMLTAGLIAASFLVCTGGAVSTIPHAVARSRQTLGVAGASDAPNVPSLVNKTVLQLRGGDYEIESATHSAPPPLEFAHGTTTLSFIFQGGIVAAVDSRASLGSFVGSKTTQKVLPVNSHILGTMAGGAADCMFWIRKLKSEAMLHELVEGYRMTVARASRLLSNALYENRRLGLSVGTMIMGFNPEDGPPKIYYVDNTGVRIEGDLFAVGSGSTFALGILDGERRDDMTEREAIQLGIKAIRHATFRDAYSGGFINVFLITRDGWRKVFTEDLAGKRLKVE